MILDRPEMIRPSLKIAGGEWNSLEKKNLEELFSYLCKHMGSGAGFLPEQREHKGCLRLGLFCTIGVACEME